MNGDVAELVVPRLVLRRRHRPRDEPPLDGDSARSADHHQVRPNGDSARSVDHHQVRANEDSAHIADHQGRPTWASAHGAGHHQSRPAGTGSDHPQDRDQSRHSSRHRQRTPTRPPEENSSSRAGGGGTPYAAARRRVDIPRNLREQRGARDHTWVNGSGAWSSEATHGSVRQQSRRRNPFRAAVAALIAMFGIKCGVKSKERKTITAGGMQMARVSPLQTPAVASDRNRWQHTTDSTQGSRHRGRTVAATPVASPIPEGVAVNFRSGSGKSYYSSRDSPLGSEASRRRGRSTGLALTIDDVLLATGNFSRTCRIGQGDFASVYRGTLPDGKVVAIKRAKVSGDHFIDPEFQSEISILPHVTHLNLVRFLCYVEGGGERAIVVEYVPNGTLRQHLDGLYGTPLDFLVRLSIAVDIANAVTYLHSYADHPIIHRDIKASNILLTKSLRAKVGDFGFARLGPLEGSYVVTRIKGTTGYLDPEYLKTQQLTDKSDVYAFGVLLVELLSGRRPLERRRSAAERVTADWAMAMFRCGEASQVLDPNIPMSPAVNLALEKTLELASQCLAPTKNGRPTMKDCGQILMGIRKDYTEFSEYKPNLITKQSFC